METITIKEIENKFGKPNEKGICTPFWVIKFDNRTGTIWDNQIADYMKNDVGIGGSCNVEIKVTDQGYNNIRVIDMTSAKKGEKILTPQLPPFNNDDDKKKGTPQLMEEYEASKGLKLMSVKDISIVSQMIMKCATELMAQQELKPMSQEDVGKGLCGYAIELHKAYRLSVLHFEQNG